MLGGVIPLLAVVKRGSRANLRWRTAARHRAQCLGSNGVEDPAEQVRHGLYVLHTRAHKQQKQVPPMQVHGLRTINYSTTLGSRTSSYLCWVFTPSIHMSQQLEFRVSECPAHSQSVACVSGTGALLRRKRARHLMYLT
jgi:hypothetical protein